MNDEPYWELLAKYFSGQASDREIEMLEEWIESDPDRRELLNEASTTWHATKDRSTLDVDTSKAWEALSDRIDEGARQSSGGRTAAPARAKRAPKSRSRSVRRRLLRAVGGIALLLGAAVLVMWWRGSDDQVIATERGERSSLKLIDGTRVHLNADSKLTLLPGFGQDSREVKLEGEAYFDVTHVDDRLFRVHTSEGAVRVVGTAFNVHAYADEKEAQVAVSQGRVALDLRKSMRASHPDTVILEPRQVGVMADQRVRSLQNDVDLRPFTAWKDGQLVFDDAPFSEVIRRLERWFDLQIEVQAPIASIDQLNAVFEGESVQEVISDIAIALDLEYDIEGSHITFLRHSSMMPSTSTEASFKHPKLDVVDH